MSIYKNINVLDLTIGPVGGLTTMVMADFGASVIKIEPLKGDPFREMPSSTTWLRGKRSIVMELQRNSEQVKLHGYIKNADVVITNARPKIAKRLGIDSAKILSINKRIILCSITGFEEKGKLANIPGYEGLIAAKTGYMMTFEGIGRDKNKYREGPAYSGVLLASHAASQIALQSITAALIYRNQTGNGQLIKTSLTRAMIPIDTAGLFIAQIRERLGDKLPEAIDPEFGMLPSLGYHPVPTKDGKWIQLAGLVSHLFHAFIDTVGLKDIYNNPDFIDPAGMDNKTKTKLAKIIAQRMMEQNSSDWMKSFIDNGNVAAEEWHSTKESMKHPQIIHNKDIWHYHDKKLGETQQLGPLAHFSVTQGKHPGKKPFINQDNGYIWPNKQVKRIAIKKAVLLHGPLDGITFLEFSSIIAAPYAASILGELGARVIKIEPLSGDNFRVGANPGTGKQIKGLGAIKTTSNKESICLNLKSEKGIEIAHRLISQANGMLHNYRPGVPERLKIDWQTVSNINNSIVYVSAWGYGKNGPYAHRPTAAPGVGAAMGGPLKQFGGKLPNIHKDNLTESIKEAIKINTANPGSSDYNASHIIASAAIMGLYEQNQNGTSQQIDCNMLAANAYANFEHFIDYKDMPNIEEVDNNLFGLNNLYRLYNTESGWIFFACSNQKDWDNFLKYLITRSNNIANLKKLIKKLPVNIIGIQENHTQILEKIFIKQNASTWEDNLTALDIGCVHASEYLPGTFWYNDQHVKDNNLTVQVKNPIWETITRHATLSEFNDFPQREGMQSTAGQHSEEILLSLGYAQKDILELKKNNIIASHDDR